MMLWPVVIGGILGLALVGALYRIGALQERSSLAVMLGAIAFFWPVFAVQADSDRNHSRSPRCGLCSICSARRFWISQERFRACLRADSAWWV